MLAVGQLTGFPDVSDKCALVYSSSDIYELEFYSSTTMEQKNSLFSRLRFQANTSEKISHNFMIYHVLEKRNAHFMAGSDLKGIQDLDYWIPTTYQKPCPIPHHGTRRCSTVACSSGQAFFCNRGDMCTIRHALLPLHSNAA